MSKWFLLDRNGNHTLPRSSRAWARRSARGPGGDSQEAGGPCPAPWLPFSPQMRAAYAHRPQSREGAQVSPAVTTIPPLATQSRAGSSDGAFARAAPAPVSVGTEVIFLEIGWLF